MRLLLTRVVSVTTALAALPACGEVVNVGGPNVADAASELSTRPVSKLPSEAGAQDGKTGDATSKADSVAPSRDAGADVEVQINPPAEERCPATTPDPQGKVACGTEGLQCEYGTDPAIECDTIVTCTGGAWVTTQTPFTGPFCSASNGGSCPEAVEEVAQGTACGSTFFECDIPGAHCGCPPARCECRCPGAGDGTTCTTMMTWQCDSVTTQGCPAIRPRLGASCTTPNQSCDYDGADAGACWGDSVQCIGGVWTGSGGAGC
jgi:hypothetical protein